jgi:ankyrin repeat protein
MTDTTAQNFDKAAKRRKKWGKIPKRAHNIPKEDGSKFLEAAEKGDIEAVTQFLDRYGKEILEIRERDGYNTKGYTKGCSDAYTTLMHAVAEGHRAVAELLLDRGADIHARCDDGYTVLILALDEDHNLADLVLDRGADIATRNDAGETALMFPQTAESLKYLLSRGADLHARNDAGENTLMMICSDTYLHREHLRPSSGMEVLLDAGIDIDARDSKGMTALMIAAERSVYDDDTPDKLACLIKRGANPLVRDKEGNTASMHALRPRPDLDGDKARQKEMGALLLATEKDWNEKQVEACINGSTQSITVNRPIQFRKPAPA